MPWRGNEEELDTTELTPIFVNQSGDKLQGTLDMNFHKIINIPTPIERGDVSNRDYVDIVANNIKLFVKDRYPKIAGFRLVKTVTPTDFTATIKIIVPKEISANRIFCHTFHPLITIIKYRAITELGTHTTTKAYYELAFKEPMEGSYKVMIEGLVYILPYDILTFSGNKVNISLESDIPSTVNENEDDEDDEGSEE